MNKKTLRFNLSNIFLYILWIAVLLTIAFVLSPNDYQADVCRVFYIEYNKISLILFFAFLIFVTSLFLYKNFKIDRNSIFLMLRIPIVLLPMFYIDSGLISIGRILIQILILIAYISGLNYKGSNSFIIISYLIFSLIIATQTFLQSSQLDYSVYDMWYSYFMRIPVGASNVIGGFLTGPTLAFILVKTNNKLLKYVCLILGLFLIYSTYLTGSEGSILLLFIAMCLIILRKIIIIKNKITSSVFIFTGIIIVFILILISNYITIFFEGMLDDVSHDRFPLIISGLETFLKHPLFGGGMGYSKIGFSGSHNIIIELLRESGLIGFILFFIPLGDVIYKSIQSYRLNGLLKYIGLIVFIMFGHMLFETSYFNYSNDFIFWFFCGLISSRMKEEKIHTHDRYVEQ